MFRSSYLHEVCKEKYECTDSREELHLPGISYPESATLDWKSLQELNKCFTKYINRAHVLEQQNAIFRKQLETLRRMEEVSIPEDVIVDQIKLNRQRISELSSQHTKLKHERKDAERALNEHNNRFMNACEYQQQLQSTLQQLNKEADAALLRNLEFHIQCQFLQEDINSTKERNKKNLSEVQAYVDILRQIDQANPQVSVVSRVIIEQEKLLAQRCVPTLQSHLEEYRGTLCQLQSEKERLQNETAVLEQTIKTTQESYDGEIQLYNEKIDMLCKDVEEAARTLEKYTSKCRHQAIYQTSLENELERYRRIIKNEGSRLNLAIAGTPVMFSTNFQFAPTSLMGSRGSDLTHAIQDITSPKLCQKVQTTKMLKKKEITSKENVLEEMERGDQVEEEKEIEEHMESVLYQNNDPEDVPDGNRISKGFNMLRDLLRGRLDKHKRVPEPEPELEPVVDIYTKGRCVSISGGSSYVSPYLYSSSPSAGHIFIIDKNSATPLDEDLGRELPIPVPSPAPSPPPLTPSTTTGIGKECANSKNVRKEGDEDEDIIEGEDGKSNENEGEEESQHPETDLAQPFRANTRDNISDDSSRYLALPLMPLSRASPTSDFFSYEKVEMVESVKKISDNDRMKAYKKTAVIVETMVEKTSKIKHGGRSS